MIRASTVYSVIANLLLDACFVESYRRRDIKVFVGSTVWVGSEKVAFFDD
jgi:hypothetical protein